MASFVRVGWRVVRETGQSLRKLNQLDFFPLRKHLRGYGGAALAGDARAGFNVALLAFPQGIAYALIAGLPIEYGIFGSAVAALMGAFFAGSHFIMQGPTNATAVTLFIAFAALGATAAEKLVYLPMLLCLVGVFLMVGAYLRVANLIQYISRTVVTAYITAAATLIMANQVRNALGFGFGEGEEGTTFFHIVYLTAKHLPETHPATLAISLIAAAVMIIIKRFFKSLPNVAITLILMSVVAYLMETYGGWSVARLDAVSASSWNMTLPDLDWNVLGQLSGTAIAIALLCVLEGTSIGNSLAAKAGSRLNANQEMFSIGASNLACGLFNGMPASGSLTRSALAFESGARSPVAGLFTGGVIVAAIVALGSFIQYIPKAALAVVVIFIGISLINARAIKLVTRTTQSDRIVFWSTFISGMLLPLDDAIYLGVGISIALFLRKVGQPEMVEYVFDDQGQLKALDHEHARPIEEISIVHVEGDLFFGAAGGFYEQMRRVCEDPALKVMVLKMRNAHHLDATSMMALEELINYMNDHDRTLMISEARDEVVRVLANSGLLDRLGRHNVFPDNPQNPTLSTARALRRARTLVGGDAESKVSVFGSNPLPENA
ncbi:MAG: SulP family inorganic anion transporter [Verrucomicrobiota bacterium]